MEQNKTRNKKSHKTEAYEIHVSKSWLTNAGKGSIRGDETWFRKAELDANKKEIHDVMKRKQNKAKMVRNKENQLS